VVEVAEMVVHDRGIHAGAPCERTDGETVESGFARDVDGEARQRLR
jgi:hypothetical protein